MELEHSAPREIELATVENADKPFKPGFSWAAFCGGLAAVVWVAGAIGAPLSFYGAQQLATLNPALQAALVAIAFGPAILFWLAAQAVGEAAKARALAAELTRITQESNLSTEAGEITAKRLTMTVKTEIEMLNDAVEAALGRLNELEASAQRNALLFSQTLADTRDNAGSFIIDLHREREAFMALNDDLKTNTEDMVGTVGRQIRLMREASKLVTTEMNAAEDALENHYVSFSNSATVMAQRTAEFHNAAETAQNASVTLEHSMGGVLEGLAEATKLTDSARRSAEEATHAATTTANAVRETTQRAVFEAKKAAQLIRAETVALQDAAADTLAKLREAAEAARDASEQSQAAADRHAASIEKRLGALAATAQTRKAVAAPATTVVAERTIEQVAVIANEPVEERLYANASRALAAPKTGFSGMKGFTGWTNFLPSQQHAYDEPANADTIDADAFADFGAVEADIDAQLKQDAIEIIAAAGVSLDHTLDARALEAIANASRMGALARRRAVAEAAPVAVSRIARYVKRNNDAKIAAADFRARPDLAKAEDKGSDLVRAYLLIDAALA